METTLQFLLLGLHISAPIAFASLGGIFSERSGVINIGLEGIMIVATFFMAWGGLTFGTPIAGLIAAIIAGALMALVHAIATITFKVDQIVSGVALNILALGVSRFLSQQIYGQETQTPVNSALFPAFLAANSISLLLIPIAVLVWYVLFHTSFGLRLRAVGENPESADTLGINVFFMRYVGVILSGVMVGFSAATLYPSQWFSGMTGGRGFIALAAMIFGRWHPIGAVAAALLFGYADTFRIMFELRVPVPAQFVQMLPYVLAVVVLAGFIGRARAPGAVGKPYEKGGQ
ncbi:MAG: ABC transporter permease [Spirochaetaceae bacterium]